MTAAAFLGIDVPEEQTGWLERGPLPYFWGRSFDEHVAEWRLVDREAQDKTWRLAAIAFSLERSSGGRPRGEQKRLKTTIQRFCEAVKTDRQTFQRLCRTYRTFSNIRTSGGTGFEPDLPFKYYEVAARLAGSDAPDAIAEAREKRWSANTLERELGARRDRRPQKRRQVSLERARGRILKMVEAWPEPDQRLAVQMLRRLAADLEGDLGPPPPPVIEQIAELEEHATGPEWEEIAELEEHAPEPEWQVEM